MDSSKRLMIAGSAIVAIVAGVGIVVTSQISNSATSPPPRGSVDMPRPPKKSESVSDLEEEKWKSRLTKEQYAIAREKGTEPAFTGKYWNHKGKGIYKCVCCETPLFDAAAKFDSGTGWPSFFQPIDEKKIGTEADFGLFVQRTEVLCAKCHAHLGHLFEDGPEPTGLRYCINSASLDFEGETLKTAKGH